MVLSPIQYVYMVVCSTHLLVYLLLQHNSVKFLYSSFSSIECGLALSTLVNKTRQKWKGLACSLTWNPGTNIWTILG
jgi:hypothetical protein